jgi:hypothetical protein
MKAVNGIYRIRWLNRIGIYPGNKITLRVR